MIFGILFIVAFIIGYCVYRVRQHWITAVAVPCLLYLLTVLLDSEARSAWQFSISFGLPIVFVAALLGPYVAVLRAGVEEAQGDDELNPQDIAD